MHNVIYDILTAITPPCYITMIDILIPSVVTINTIVHAYTYSVYVCLYKLMLTFEDHTFHDFAVLYILVGMGRHFGSRNSEDHELSHSPYEYDH